MDDLEDPPRKNRAAQWDDQMAWTPCWSPVHFFRCQVPQSGWFTQKGPKSLFSRVKRISRKYIYIYILICMLSPLSIPIAPVPFGSQKTSPSTRSRCLVRWLPNMRDEVFRRPQSNEVLTQLWYMARNHMCNRVVVEYPQLCICVYNCIFVHMYV